MAGDWMKIELDLPDKPEVHYIAGVTNLDCDSVVGKLVRVWSWFDKHTKDGHAHGVTFALVDRLVSVTGFGEAMSFAGWLEQQDKTLIMPKFERHTSKSAKNRALTTQRQSNKRHATVTHVSRNKRDKNVTREEKRREESTSTPIAPLPDLFAEFWKTYPRKEAKQDALKAWNRLNLQNSDFEKVMAALEAVKNTDQWRRDKGAFVPHAATWLNGRRFEDDLLTEAAPTGSTRVAI